MKSAEKEKHYQAFYRQGNLSQALYNQGNEHQFWTGIYNLYTVKRGGSWNEQDPIVNISKFTH